MHPDLFLVLVQHPFRQRNGIGDVSVQVYLDDIRLAKGPDVVFVIDNRIIDVLALRKFADGNQIERRSVDSYRLASRLLFLSEYADEVVVRIRICADFPSAVETTVYDCASIGVLPIVVAGKGHHRERALRRGVEGVAVNLYAGLSVERNSVIPASTENLACAEHALLDVSDVGYRGGAGLLYGIDASGFRPIVDVQHDSLGIAIANHLGNVVLRDPVVLVLASVSEHHSGRNVYHARSVPVAQRLVLRYDCGVVPPVHPHRAGRFNQVSRKPSAEPDPVVQLPRLGTSTGILPLVIHVVHVNAVRAIGGVSADGPVLAKTGVVYRKPAGVPDIVLVLEIPRNEREMEVVVLANVEHLVAIPRFESQTDVVPWGLLIRIGENVSVGPEIYVLSAMHRWIPPSIPSCTNSSMFRCFLPSSPPSCRHRTPVWCQRP